jgi:hypothetical protein
MGKSKPANSLFYLAGIVGIHNVDISSPAEILQSSMSLIGVLRFGRECVDLLGSQVIDDQHIHRPVNSLHFFGVCVHVVERDARPEFAVELSGHSTSLAWFASETSFAACFAMGILGKVSHQVLDAHGFRPKLLFAHTTAIVFWSFSFLR